MVKQNRNKLSISLAVSPHTKNKMESLVSTKQFGSVSDVVNTAVLMFLGKLSLCKNEMDFNYFVSSAINDEAEKIKKEQISVSYNKFVDDELKDLSILLEKSKSFIVRMAINDFLGFIPVRKRFIGYKIGNIHIEEELKEFI